MGKEKSEKQLTFYNLVQTNINLAITKALAVIPTQPWHVIMRNQQGALASSDNPRVLSILQAYREIRTGRSIKPLYKGTVSGLSKEGLKNLIYKGAFIKGAPTLAESILPGSLQHSISPIQYKLVKLLVASMIAGVADSTIGGPLELIATYGATSQGKHANASILKELALQPSIIGKVRRLYRGYFPATVKSAATFLPYFSFKDPIERMTASFYGISPSEPTPWYCTGTSAVLVGFTVALCASPWDIVKTNFQMPGSKETSAYQTLWKNYKLHGIQGVTAGLPAKILITTIGWGLNFFATQDSTENKKNKREKIYPDKNEIYNSGPLPPH